jgi:hypothetical protein
VPWRLLSRDLNHEFIASDSLPNDLMLLDPSKLRTLDISMIWDHWLTRQKSGLQGLVFLKAQVGDMLEKQPDPKGGKGKNDYLEIDPPKGDEDQNGGGSGKDKQGGKKGDKGNNGEDLGGQSDEVHPLSPKAHEVKKGEFLATLSNDSIYVRFIQSLGSKPQVSSLVLLQIYKG